MKENFVRNLLGKKMKEFQGISYKNKALKFEAENKKLRKIYDAAKRVVEREWLECPEGFNENMCVCCGGGDKKPHEKDCEWQMLKDVVNSMEEK